MKQFKKQATAFRILTSLLTAIALIVLIAIAAAYWYFVPHGRSVEAYCREYHNIESSFDHGGISVAGLSSDKVGDLANGLADLEHHAPGDIQPDLALLVDTYKKLDSHPAYSIAANEEGAALDKAAKHVQEWTGHECIQTR